MTFLNSLKLFGSNWVKTLKFILYYVVVWGLCFALLLPAYFEFKSLIVSSFETTTALNAMSGAFGGSIGESLYYLLHILTNLVVAIFSQNVSIACYAVAVILVILPILINIGKYAFNEMIYSYMTSKTKVGFFSALIRSLKRSVVFAICKTFYNLFFVAIVLFSLYGLSLIGDVVFVAYFLPIVAFLVLVLLYTFNQLTVLGWASAMIVFDCNVFSAYRKGMKAVNRHFWATFATTSLYFALFWAIMIVFGPYSFVALVPIMSALLCIFDMVIFFTSQGMRFYINETKILTPKKLEEVDDIKKSSAIL